MKIILFICVCFGMTLIAQSQQNINLSGHITDETNGESIPFASIELRNTNDDSYFSATTNVYGFYTLFIPKGKYEFIISSAGFSTKKDTLIFNESQTKNHELKKRQQDLEEVTVRSYAKRLSNTEISSHEVVVAEIKKLPVVLGEPDILKTLQLFPGITTVGDATIGFNVRGGNTDQNLILLDEAPLFNPSHVFGLFSTFNSTAISTFKIYKGGIPAKFGGRLSSVLDVRQFEGNAKSYQLDGGIGLLAANLSIQGPIYKKKGEQQANNSFFISARRSYFDLFLKVSSDPNLNSSILYFYDINVKTNWKPNQNNHLFLSAYIGEDQFGLGSQFGYGWGNIASTLRWNHVYSSRIFSNISFVYSRYDYSIGLNEPAEVAFTWKGSIDNIFLKGDWEYKLNQHNSFNVGFMTSYINTNPGNLRVTGILSTLGSINVANEKGMESGIYAEWIKKIGKRLTFQAGLRLNWFARLGEDEIRLYENNQPVVYLSDIQIYQKAIYTGTKKYTNNIYYDDVSIDPRLNISFVVNPIFSVKASYNTMHQYMQQITNNSSILPVDIYRLAGTYVKPLAAHQISLGLFSTIPFKGKHIDVSIEGFYKAMENTLDYIDGANLLFNSHVETELLPSSAYSYGVEFFAEKKWGKFTGWLSYTFSSSIYQPVSPIAGGPGANYGRPYSAPFDLPHSLALVANYAFTNRIRLSASFVLRSGKPTTYPTSQFVYNGRTIPFFGGRNEFRFPMYHRLDLSVTFEGKQRKHFKSDFVISIYNLYNQQNPNTYIFSSTTKDKGLLIETENKVQQLSIYGIVPSVLWLFTIK